MTDVQTRTLTQEQVELREAMVKAARDMLLACGLETRDPRFPWAMHHAHYRTRLRLEGRRPRHSEVAALLGEWAAGQPEGADIWQAVSGAAAGMGRRDLPDGIRERLARHVPTFDDWLRAQEGVSLSPGGTVLPLPGRGGR